MAIRPIFILLATQLMSGCAGLIVADVALRIAVDAAENYKRTATSKTGNQQISNTNTPFFGGMSNQQICLWMSSGLVSVSDQQSANAELRRRSASCGPNSIQQATQTAPQQNTSVAPRFAPATQSTLAITANASSPNSGSFFSRMSNQQICSWMNSGLVSTSDQESAKTELRLRQARCGPNSIQQATQTAPPQNTSVAPRSAPATQSTLSITANASSPNSNGVVTLNITTNTDTASLKINGDEAGGRADGRYSVNRFAKIGSNSFEIVATDRYGNSSRQTVVVNREIQVVAERTRSLNPTLISAAKSRDAVAIIIGIEKYRRVPDADFANNDANAFYDYARRALGIKPENIRLLVDDKADASEILRAFNSWLPTRVKKDTTDVYVFYSGHGLPSEDGSSLYFLPHEVDRDLLGRTAITQKEVVQTIQRTNPKSVTMFIDSCYSGQSRTGETLLANARPISIAPKASTDFPPNFMVISASAPDQLSSSSPELKHGIFSYYLMLGMEGEADGNKDGQITVGEMQSYLSQQVTRRAIGMNRTQSPQTTGDLHRVLIGW